MESIAQRSNIRTINEVDHIDALWRRMLIVSKAHAISAHLITYQPPIENIPQDSSVTDLFNYLSHLITYLSLP